MENHYSGTIVLVIENSATIVSCMQVQFLVQSFFETLHYCDEWRKFTSVIQSFSHSVIHSVNSGGVSQILPMYETLYLTDILTMFKQ